MGKDKQSTLSRWIYGYWLMRICTNINDATLKEWVINHKLTAYNPDTFEPLSKAEDVNPRGIIGITTLENIKKEALENYVFKSDEFIQFAREHNLHECLRELENVYPDFFPRRTASEVKTLTAKELRELGQLRTEKQKWDESIKVAIEAVLFCSSQRQPVTRQQLHDELYKLNLDSIPDTTFERIWQAIPKKFRNLGGRPKSSP